MQKVVLIDGLSILNRALASSGWIAQIFFHSIADCWLFCNIPYRLKLLIICKKGGAMLRLSNSICFCAAIESHRYQ